MTTIALRASQWSNAPQLQPVRNDEVAARRGDEQVRDAAGFEARSPACNDHSRDEDAPVLVAGPDPAVRAEVLNDLVASMPPRTLFQQVGTFWEVLVRAPLARVVVLSGELDGIPTESLRHMLSRRHPRLPVVSFDAPASGDDARARR